MKRTIGVAVLLVAVIFLIAMGVRHGMSREETPSQAQEEALILPDSGHSLTVLQSDGSVQTMDIDQYLWGVVAAEMPASFHQEALKAQAVAARTYAIAKAGHSTRHPQADLCTDYRCCQAWISRSSAESNWGEGAIHYGNKITTAVAETSGKVVLYDGNLIDAVFHSSSADATQDAVEVWGNSVPYLQSVTSPEGDEVPGYQSTVTIPTEEFRSLFLAARSEAVLDGDPAAWIGDTVYNDGGSVRTIVIGGVEVTGAQARSIFNLRSAAFTVTYTADGFTFQTTGFGHGVGMSQYGANTMAQEGSTYTDILTHYYTGVTVADCPADRYPVQAAQTEETAEGTDQQEVAQ